MDPTDLLFAIFLLPLLALSGVFSGSETALFGLSQPDLNELRQQHRVASRAVERLVANPARLLVTILTLNMSVNVLYFVIASVLTVHADNALTRTAISLGSLAAIILFGEVLAKIIANTRRVEFCVLFAPPLATAMGAIGPAMEALDRFIVAPVVRVLRPKVSSSSRLAPDDLERLLSVSARQGAISAIEQRLLESVLDLGERRVRDVMLPRLDMPSLAPDSTLETAARLASQTRRGILPLAVGGLDGDIRGLIDVPAWVIASSVTGEREPRVDSAPVVKSLFMPDHARLDRALETFRRAAADTAICVDEHGAVVGLLERDALLELALLSAPNPPENDAPGIEPLDDGRFRAPGRFDAKLFAEAFGLTGEAERVAQRVSTVGGLAIALLGRVPSPGEEFALGRVRARVEDVRRNVPTSLQIWFESDDDGAASTDERRDGPGSAP